MKKINYRVTHPEPTVCDSHFQSLSAARQFIREHLRGFPKNKLMTKENRKYWKQIGKGMKIFKVTENWEEVI